MFTNVVQINAFPALYTFDHHTRLELYPALFNFVCLFSFPHPLLVCFQFAFVFFISAPIKCLFPVCVCLNVEPKLHIYFHSPWGMRHEHYASCSVYVVSLQLTFRPFLSPVPHSNGVSPFSGSLDRGTRSRFPFRYPPWSRSFFPLSLRSGRRVWPVIYR